MNDETRQPIEHPVRQLLQDRLTSPSPRYVGLVSRDGIARPIAEHSALIRDDAGSVLGAVVVVVTADHGEEFGEHGGAYHGTTLFDEQIRVPLVVLVHGDHTQRVSAPGSTVDVAPILLSLAGVTWAAPFDGSTGPGTSSERSQDMAAPHRSSRKWRAGRRW